ncbi:MAG: hypothetical protein AAGA96_13550 [Verrucomicrobiota bacterium]
MRGDIEELYEELARSPEDWSVRIRLIQAAAHEGDLKEAKRLVRSSPGNEPLPLELQERVRALMEEAGRNETRARSEAEDA